MGTDIKLKDLFGQTQTEQDISTVSVPKADGTGREFYVKRPVIYYKLVASPPYAPQEGDNTIIFWNLGDGGFGTDPDIGNCLGGYHEAVEGKTTKPIISITVSKYMEGIAADNSGNATVLYLYEALAGETLLEVAGVAGTADFTAQPGWGQLIQGADGQTYTYTQITDLNSIAIGIEQPNNILNQRLFYSFLTEKTNSDVAYTAAKNGAHTIVPPAESSGISAVNLTVDVPEPNLQDKSVAITENGTQEFSADTGYDGIKKLTATVNVAGGGGTSVQPDYLQNNSAAADYIKNRPGGYMIEYPSITKTFTGTTDDPNYIGGGGEDPNLFRFSDTPLPSEAILKGVGKFTKSDGTITEIETISVGEEIGGVGTAFFVTAGDANAEIYLLHQEMEGIPGVIFASVPGGAYISEFTSAAVSEPAVIDEKYLAVKPSNWGATWPTPIPGQADGYIASKIGGFWGSKNNPWDFDGYLTGKETYVPKNSDYMWVKVSDDAVPFDYVLNSFVYHKDFESSGGSGSSVNRENITLFANLEGHPVTDGDGFTVEMTDMFPGQEAGKAIDVLLSVQTPYVTMGGIRFSQGTWYLYKKAGTDGTPAHFISGVLWGNGGTTGDHIVRMPYEFVEQHPNTLTTDAQTLTDAQKLQARTNIGTVEGTDKEMILSSSTTGSTKKFKITVTDDGTLTATEVTQ